MDWAWVLTQAVGGYHDLKQVDRTSTQLGYVVRSLADIAATEQEQDQRWKPAEGLLAIASHSLHDIPNRVGVLTESRSLPASARWRPAAPNPAHEQG